MNATAEQYRREWKAKSHPDVYVPRALREQEGEE